jgi:hypothetical protein
MIAASGENMQRKMVLVLLVVCALLVLSPAFGVAEDKAPEETKNTISVNVLATAVLAILPVVVYSTNPLRKFP